MSDEFDESDEPDNLESKNEENNLRKSLISRNEESRFLEEEKGRPIIEDVKNDNEETSLLDHSSSSDESVSEAIVINSNSYEITTKIKKKAFDHKNILWKEWNSLSGFCNNFGNILEDPVSIQLCCCGCYSTMWFLLIISQLIFLIQYLSILALLFLTIFADDETMEKSGKIIRKIVLIVEVIEIVIYMIERLIESFTRQKEFKFLSTICFIDDTIEEGLTYILPIILEGMEEVSIHIKIAILSFIAVLMTCGFDNRVYKISGMICHRLEPNPEEFEKKIKLIREQPLLKSLFRVFTKVEWSICYNRVIFKKKDKGLYQKFILKPLKDVLPCIFPHILFFSLFISSFIAWNVVMGKNDSAYSDAFGNGSIKHQGLFIWSYLMGIFGLLYFKITARHVEYILENLKVAVFLLSILFSTIQIAVLILISKLGPQVGVQVSGIIILVFWILVLFEYVLRAFLGCPVLLYEIVEICYCADCDFAYSEHELKEEELDFCERGDKSISFWCSRKSKIYWKNYKKRRKYNSK